MGWLPRIAVRPVGLPVAGPLFCRVDPKIRSLGPAEFGAEELGRAGGDDLGAGLGPAGQCGKVAHDAVNENAAAGK